MQIIINDANILIDLLKIDIVDSFFQLPYQMHTTEEVLAEVEDPNQKVFETYINADQFQVKVFEYPEIVSITQLLEKHSSLSFQDCGCFFYSELLSSPLLTGDKRLRKAALKEKITVYGILWVFDQLLVHKIITKEIAHEKLSNLITINPRLPKTECRKRLNLWREYQKSGS